MPAPGAYKYITPRYTIGVDSWVPFGRPRDQAMRSWLTLRVLISLSGLKRCSSKVRFIMSQSAGSGLANIAAVTGTNVCAEAFAANPLTDENAIITTIATREVGSMFFLPETSLDHLPESSSTTARWRDIAPTLVRAL